MSEPSCASLDKQPVKRAGKAGKRRCPAMMKRTKTDILIGVFLIIVLVSFGLCIAFIRMSTNNDSRPEPAAAENRSDEFLADQELSGMMASIAAEVEADLVEENGEAPEQWRARSTSRNKNLWSALTQYASLKSGSSKEGNEKIKKIMVEDADTALDMRATLLQSMGRTGLCVLTKTLLSAPYVLGDNRVSRSFARTVVYNVCLIMKEEAFCRGIADNLTPWLVRVTSSIPPFSATASRFCAGVFGVCKEPKSTLPSMPNFEQLAAFPTDSFAATSVPPKPVSKKQLVRILHITDIHLQLTYKYGSVVDCGQVMCCRADSTPSANATDMGARPYGERTCDAPIELLESAMQAIKELDPKPVLTVFTGDIPDHDISGNTKESVVEAVRTTLNVFKKYGHDNILLAVGNHLPSPVNYFPTWNVSNTRDAWIYHLHGNYMHNMLNATESERFRGLGYYSMRPFEGLKIIVVNMNFMYTLNFFSYLQSSDSVEPKTMVEWLAAEVLDSKQRNEPYYLVGHQAVAGDTLAEYGHRIYEIIQQYPPAASFWGHTHKDEFQIFYKDERNRNSQTALSVGYIGPSITPFTDGNPSFRVYEVDSETFEIMDSLTYQMNLDDAHNLNRAKRLPGNSSTLPANCTVLRR